MTHTCPNCLYVFEDVDVDDDENGLISQEQEALFMEFLDKKPTEAQFANEFPTADPVLLSWYWGVKFSNV
jgi:hypothetical protein